MPNGFWIYSEAILFIFGLSFAINEDVIPLYTGMESIFYREPRYSRPGNKVVSTLETNIVNRHLRTRDILEKQFSDFCELTADEQLIVHNMYNSGEKMTTEKPLSLQVGVGHLLLNYFIIFVTWKSLLALVQVKMTVIGTIFYRSWVTFSNRNTVENRGIYYWSFGEGTMQELIDKSFG